ncbi:hypothetical protein C1884_17995 [Pseudomonas sp. GW460-R15]|nr:hypothetical protein C1887_20600 [Pseudomonas sp. GW456-R21]POA65380.1 hypothetical protein C1884_17995 [Pseudomonas sp. GW460-R15]
MKHMLMGVPHDEDFPTLEKELPLTATELMPIMGWRHPNECAFDYLLTEQQICDIEKACSIRLPRDLELFLTSFA